MPNAESLPNTRAIYTLYVSLSSIPEKGNPGIIEYITIPSNTQPTINEVYSAFLDKLYLSFSSYLKNFLTNNFSIRNVADNVNITTLTIDIKYVENILN